MGWLYRSRESRKPLLLKPLRLTGAQHSASAGLQSESCQSTASPHAHTVHSSCAFLLTTPRPTCCARVCSETRVWQTITGLQGWYLLSQEKSRSSRPNWLRASNPETNLPSLPTAGIIIDVGLLRMHSLPHLFSPRPQDLALSTHFLPCCQAPQSCAWLCTWCFCLGLYKSLSSENQMCV